MARFRRNKPFFSRHKRPQNGEGSPRIPYRKRIPVSEMKKGIVILPSLLTLFSIFFGFWSLVNTIKGDFVFAAAFILVAGFFDGIDGKVARLTKSTTRFGLELDSLADVISFGIAPGLLIYVWALADYQRIGWVTAFVFVACGALRLARFNVQSGTIDPKRFNGLPIPAAAAMIATLVLFFNKLSLSPKDYGISVLVLTYLLAFLMVSSIKFHAFKDLTVVRRKPFSSTVAFVLVMAFVAAHPSIVPFILCSAYVISGPILTIYLLHGQKERPEPNEPQKEGAANVTTS